MMRRALLRLAMAILLAAPGISSWAASVKVLTIDGAIGPATADYIRRGLAHAREENVALVVLSIDTPGGLDSSMRTIIKDIFASPIPVATYVAPGGARAASAGTYILYASHVAAMAPGTNLGAATPVRIGGSEHEAPEKKPDGSGDESKREQNKNADKNAKPPEDDATSEPMTRKQVNDAAAYIRGLAQLRGRNAQWAEDAVRKAVSLSADEALKLHVIDYVARDIDELLRQADGKTVALPGGSRQLNIAGAAVTYYQPDWRVRFLAAITDPSLALLLMTIGIYGLIFELANPGTAVPGVLGGICLLLALYALQLLPVNYAGLALVLLGLGFMVAEAFLPSFGALGVGGIAAFITGAVILIDTEVPGFGIPLALIVTIAVASALLIATVVGIGLKSRRLAVVSGAEQMIGIQGEIIEVNSSQAWAMVHGERWQVTSKEPLRPGEQIRVLARSGLVLEVAPTAFPLNKTTGE